jgi:hypothetical protein
MKHLMTVQDIRILPPASDPDKGSLEVQTTGSRVAIYGASDIQEAAREGVASVVYESMHGSPLGQEWGKYGDYTDFVQAYDAWTENTQQAFESARQPGQPPDELSKLFFVASLFGDPNSDQVMVYDPAPHTVAWQVQDGGHYGFGPYSFDIYHNQIIHVAYGGSSASSSAADIPTLWARQGLGN